MKLTLATPWLYLISLMFLAVTPSPGSEAPEAVVTRLMAYVAAKPIGPAEGDVTSQAAAMYESSKKFRASLGDKRSLREMIVDTYSVCTLQGPLTRQYVEGAGALYYCKARLTPDELTECKDEAQSSATVTEGEKIVSTQKGNGPMFGESGLFSTYVGSEVSDDGEVVATFCLVKQKGSWKVHGLYFSKEVLAGDDKSFVIRQLSAFAAKQ